MAPAAMANASYKNADRRSQSHSDAERDAERAKRALFDSILRVVNQVFRRAAPPFDSAPCLAKFIFDGFLQAFDVGAQLVTNFYGFFEYLAMHCYSLLDS
jgi:hypothetical protein